MNWQEILNYRNEIAQSDLPLLQKIGAIGAIDNILQLLENAVSDVKQDWDYAEEDPMIHSDSMWLDEDFVH